MRASQAPAPSDVLAGLNVEALVPALPTPITWDEAIGTPLKAAQAAEKVQADEVVAQQKEAALAASQEAEQVPVAAIVTYSGNNYDFGSCTWYVAGLISVPSSMGNANQWGYGLLAAGWHEGAPQVGSIAQTTAGAFGHVAIVTAVLGDTVTVSEMNATAGWDAVDVRLVPLSEFNYFSR